MIKDKRVVLVPKELRDHKVHRDLWGLRVLLEIHHRVLRVPREIHQKVSKEILVLLHKEDKVIKELKEISVLKDPQVSPLKERKDL